MVVVIMMLKVMSEWRAAGVEAPVMVMVKMRILLLVVVTVMPMVMITIMSVENDVVIMTSVFR